jgi:hypothetical protein
MSEIEDRLEKIEGVLTILANRPQSNPLEAIGKIMESELVTSIQEKAESYESFTKQALIDLWKKLDAVESKINILSGHLLK